MLQGDSEPDWLQRITASGASVASAAALASAAGVEISPRTYDEGWVAQCVALEHRLFPKHEAMDIPYEVRQTRGVTLLCATPASSSSSAFTWSGPSVGSTFQPGSSCVGYAVLQRFDEASIGGSRNPYAALQPNSCLLSKLAVAPQLQRRGIGKALLAAAIGHARAMRAATCTLHVDEANTRARALYTSFGFRAQGDRLVDFYRPGRHAIEMMCDLDGCDRAEQQLSTAHTDGDGDEDEDAHDRDEDDDRCPQLAQFDRVAQMAPAQHQGADERADEGVGDAEWVEELD